MSLTLWWGVALLVVSGLFAAPALRRRFPRMSWYLVGFPVLWARMHYTWRRLAWECELAVTRRQAHALVGRVLVRGRELDPVVPRLTVVRPLPFGLVARVRMMPGQTPGTFVSAAEAMAHAWRVHAVRIGSPARGEVEFTVTARDPLTEVRPHSPAVSLRRGWSGRGRPAPKAPAGRDVLRAVVGVREDGRPWVVDLRVHPHWLITGATQSGKSTLINALVVELAPRPVALVGIDLKGGMELSVYGARLSALATTRAQAARLLAVLVDEALERMEVCRRAGVRSIWALPDAERSVPVVVLIDEVAELYLTADRSQREEVARVATSLIRLGQLGTTLGIHLVVAGQRVGSDLGDQVVALRAQLSGRICHRVADPGTATMTLGDLYPDAVEAAQMISPLEPGVAVTTDDADRWVRARSVNVGADQAMRVADQWTHIRPEIPGLDQGSADETGGGR